MKNNQHKGLGKRLVQKAEEISFKHGYNKYAIISGVGVREYYRRQGYNLKGAFMIKEFKKMSFMENIYFEVKEFLLGVLILIFSLLIGVLTGYNLGIFIYVLRYE